MAVLSTEAPAPPHQVLKPSAVNGHAAHTNGVSATTAVPQSAVLLKWFLSNYNKIKSFSNGEPVVVDGQSLSVAAITSAARYGARVTLDGSSQIQERVAASQLALRSKIDNNTSVYGVSTGFGGSADTRTDQPLVLGHALLQHQHAGVLPSSNDVLKALPLSDPLGSSSMPEAWVRGAMLVRLNSLIRGHSAVRWELIEKLNDVLNANITPLVPLRGSISASGDLSPLSYIAGTLTGNPSIRCFDGPAAFGHREVVPSTKALAAHNIKPITLVEKEPLGLLNGTAFSTSVAALALNDAVHLALLAQVCTSMGVEALLGTRGSFDEFIHNVARPHPGQVEVAETVWNLLGGSKFATTHEEEISIEEDQGQLRQDRYPLRTAPQFLGPQIEDILASLKAVTQESNSTTDNPLIDGATGNVHHGGNFQAMAISNAMEKTRLALHHIGKLLFTQCTELVNPAMNRGLPPSMAATEPSLNYHTKGVDIATAAYVSELGFLANPVTTHIQSAEMHNQAVNSLALISGRATVTALEVLTNLVASYLYVLCQAFDLRALQAEFSEGLKTIVTEELSNSFSIRDTTLTKQLMSVMSAILEASSTMDVEARMERVAAGTTNILVDTFLTSSSSTVDTAALSKLPTFRSTVATRAAGLLDTLRRDYLSGARGAAPASPFLNKSRPVYEFVRVTLGIKMHGSENYIRFARGAGTEEFTIGGNISLIQEAIRDGDMQAIVAGMFSGSS